MTMDDKIMIFNRPIWVANDEKDIRDIIEIFGCVIPSDSSLKPLYEENIEDYINYLCGVSKWEQEGNMVDGDLWFSTISGETYCLEDPFIQKYMKRARQQMHITYLVFSTNKILDNETKGLQDGVFLISKSLYNSIIEYGVIVDVQNNRVNQL